MIRLSIAPRKKASPKKWLISISRPFREDVSALGVKPATRHPRVVEFMADIIRFVEDLVDKGYAYESEGDVYFRVEKSHNYAKLANKTL